MTTEASPLRIVRRSAPHVLLVVAALLVATPLLWALKSSFTPTGEVMSTGLFQLPSRFTLDNYLLGWQSSPFATYFVNSFVVAIAVTALTLIGSVTAGYGFARFVFPGRRALFVLTLAAMMMPFQAIMIPLFVQVRSLGWLDSYAGLIIPGAVSAFGVFLMRQFLAGLPQALFEAARIDGAGELRIFLTIVVPLARGPLAALGALTFLASWNNFLWPLIVVGSTGMTTVPLGLSQFRGSNATDYGQVLAVSMLAAIPVVLVFLALRRHIVASFASSGLK
ncbi:MULTISPECIES: carbohydrate ABC transporter permease [Microbacterium]|uniref:Carbohydrate ABC transporter permease n=1 Tax=Microbacterium paraoxydans TaxID=199592 RepID=A0ABS5IM90_9MICO|nr:carbohydrate ABC transporter permease [Microbacterium paraoxydans]MBS0024067.1 carbohydrate ABC transporter permease [Microbacterium paraoxydans]